MLTMQRRIQIKIRESYKISRIYLILNLNKIDMIKVVKIETLYNVANFYSRINDKYY